MQKIIILENYKNYKRDNTYTVNENEAHSLIDSGVAKLYRVQVPKYPNKMMKPRRY